MAARRLSCSSSSRSSQCRLSALIAIGPAVSASSTNAAACAARSAGQRPRSSACSTANSRIVSSIPKRGSPPIPSPWRTRLFSTSEASPSSRSASRRPSPQTALDRPRAWSRRRRPTDPRTAVARAPRAGRSSRRWRRAASAGAPAGRARRRSARPRRSLEAAEHRLRRQEPDPRRRQLDRQRQAVQADADLGHGRRVLVRDREVGLTARARSMKRATARTATGWSMAGRLRRVRQRERRDRVLVLAGDAQHGPAGDDQDVRFGQRREQLADGCSRRR